MSKIHEEVDFESLLTFLPVGDDEPKRGSCRYGSYGLSHDKRIAVVVTHKEIGTSIPYGQDRIGSRLEVFLELFKREDEFGYVYVESGSFIKDIPLSLHENGFTSVSMLGSRLSVLSVIDDWADRWRAPKPLRDCQFKIFESIVPVSRELSNMQIKDMDFDTRHFLNVLNRIPGINRGFSIMSSYSKEHGRDIVLFTPSTYKEIVGFLNGEYKKFGMVIVVSTTADLGDRSPAKFVKDIKRVYREER